MKTDQGPVVCAQDSNRGYVCVVGKMKKKPVTLCLILVCDVHVPRRCAVKTEEVNTEQTQRALHVTAALMCGPRNLDVV